MGQRVEMKEAKLDVDKLIERLLSGARTVSSHFSFEVSNCSAIEWATQDDRDAGE